MNNAIRDVLFGLFDGGDDGEHDGTSFFGNIYDICDAGCRIGDFLWLHTNNSIFTFSHSQVSKAR